MTVTGRFGGRGRTGSLVQLEASIKVSSNNNIFHLNIDYTLALFRHPFALFGAGGHHSGSPLGFAGSRISVEMIVGDLCAQPQTVRFYGNWKPCRT